MDLRLIPDIVNITTMKQTQKKHVFHLRRVGLVGVLFVAFFIVRLDAGTLPEALRPPQVLAYATEMSRSGLLLATNNARTSQGLGALASNLQLDNSAQAKAQDMVNKDYWSHVAPDGTEPWYFFNQAGYSYSRAGENLAYGFMSSQSTIDGWLNSTAHRDNMFGAYNDVGFGIINAPSYQSSGEQTLVVAHYGTRSTPAPAPVAYTAPAASSPVGASPTTSSPQSTPTTPESAAPVAGSSPAAETPPSNASTDSTVRAQATSLAPVQTATQSRVSVLGMLGSKSLPLAAVASLVMVLTVAIGYAMTHRKAFHHALVSGEHFVVAHPGVDTAVLAATTTLILMTTYGNIS